MNARHAHSGVIVPMVSPLKSDLTTDESAVGRMMERFASAGVSVFAGGTTGESASLSVKEKIRFTELVIGRRSGETRVYAGATGNCLEECIELGQVLASMGADALVAHLPYYYPVPGRMMGRWFQRIADRVDCPLIIYNHPVLVGQSIPLDLVNELSRHPNIQGLKDSERDAGRMKRALQLWKEREDFAYLPGWASQSTPALLRGASGIVPSTGNLTPGLYRKLFDAALNGHEDEAFEIQTLTDELSGIYQQGRNISTSIPALKVLMHGLGIIEPHVLPPMEIPGPEEQKALLSVLKNFREKLPERYYE